LFLFFFSGSRAHPVLPSFPTRRSSDLLLLGDLGFQPFFGLEPRLVAHGDERLLDLLLDGEIELAAGLVEFALLAHHLGLRLLGRSEEHTSELQSRSDLVCRLLLEKKKK